VKCVFYFILFYFYMGNQKVVLFPKCMENSWEASANALR
jgi:hypothetical protein